MGAARRAFCGACARPMRGGALAHVLTQKGLARRRVCLQCSRRAVTIVIGMAELREHIEALALEERRAARRVARQRAAAGDGDEVPT